MFAPAIAFVDLETTGTTPTGDRITEIGIVRVADGEFLDEWSTLVNPECTIPGDIQILTGINNAMVRDAPTFSQLKREVYERLEGHLFVAHNARFDYGFIKNEFRRMDMKFTADVLCTVRLARKLYPEAVGHGLDALIARHGLQEPFIAPGASRLFIDAGASRPFDSAGASRPFDSAGASRPFDSAGASRPRAPQTSARTGRHSALGDARAIWRFVQMLYRERDAEEIEGAVKRLLKIPSLPPQLSPEALEGLPEGPGVYRFYGVNDLPIYIGKSVNLRERIRAHFSGDHRSANDVRLSGEIQRIEVDETAGELGALLREARLVKELLPLHNYRLRKKSNACFLRFVDLGSAPEVVTHKDIDWNTRGAGAETLFGPFATKLHIRQTLESIAAEEGLCWRQLGWEKRGGPCFARQVKRCRGACIGEETPQQHNLRLATALAPYRVNEWPWPGRVVIRERHPDGRFEEGHVFDRWCHLGTVRSQDELAELATVRAQIDFDPDIYKILLSFVAKHPRAVLPLPRHSEAHDPFAEATA